MRSLILATSDAGTASEFIASSENSRCSVRETCSPGSTIPCRTTTPTQINMRVAGTQELTKHILAASYFLFRRGTERTQTPGMAHSPQSFLLMDTNCKIGRLETEWEIFSFVTSTFHLPESDKAYICPSCIYKKRKKSIRSSLRTESRFTSTGNCLVILISHFLKLHDGSEHFPRKKRLPGDDGICCVIGSPSSQQTSTSHPSASTRISTQVKKKKHLQMRL